MIHLGPISQPTRQPVAAKASKDDWSSHIHKKSDGAAYSQQIRRSQFAPTCREKWRCDDVLCRRRRDSHTTKGGLHTRSWLHRDTHHFVRHNHEVEFLCQCSDEFELRLCINLAHRVVRGIYDQHLSAWGNSTAWVELNESTIICREDERNVPKFIEIDSPIVAGCLVECLGWGVQRNVYRFTSIEYYRWKILIEERFKHDDFISLFQECCKDRIFAWTPRVSRLCALNDVNGVYPH